MNEIYLYGSVGESFWGEESFTPTMVREQIRTVSGPLTVRVNSGGGIATDGQAIYSMLRDYPDEVHVVIDGIAASAASLIAMAGDTITMRSGALMMIHDPAQPWVDGRGTEADHLKAAEVLAIMSNAYAGIYAARAGIEIDAARDVMRTETYLDGDAAVAAGFATRIDTQAAEAVARFDYRIYARAPERLRQVSGGCARSQQKREAVMAMIAGVPALKPKEKTMGKTVQVTSAEGDDEELMVSVETETEEDEITSETEEEEDVVAVDGDEDDDAEKTPIAAKILDLYMSLNRPVSEARAAIADKITLEQAVDRITARQRKENPLADKPLRGPTARIVRDERETRRTGMTGALVAKMARSRDVAGPARDYMDMTLAEMAAVSAGMSGRVSRGGGELRAIEMAFGSHSTSDLPAVFENALNKRLLDAYTAAVPSYRAIAARMDFTDFRPHPVSGVGDWPALLPIGEGGEIKFGSVSDKKETVALVAYARGMHITRQMVVNDDLGAIDRVISTRGRAVAAFEDATFYTMMLSGANADGPTLTETSRQVFNTTDTTKAGSSAAITPASIAVATAAMRKKKGVSGDAFLSADPRILLTGPDKEFEGLQLLAPIQAAQASNVNPYVGRLQQVTAPHITGNAWYLFADPSDVPVFMYGYLQGEEGPRMRMDEPFGQQGIGYTVELDFGVGAIDFRGGFKNAGA